MARVVVDAGAAVDFERILRHLEAYGSDAAAARVASIVAALDVLSTSPQIGRPIEKGFRELVIGTGTAGFVALYRYELRRDRVIVLAIRSQREAGYRRRLH